MSIIMKVCEIRVFMWESNGPSIEIIRSMISRVNTNGKLDTPVEN